MLLCNCADGTNDYSKFNNAAYVHICANETIAGLEYLSDPEVPEGKVCY
jgi:phosphoserine aminotransferase